MLLEREHELTAVGDLIDAAREGRGRILLIEGPAGIGKTELLRAAVRGARDKGVDALHARAGELERDVPLGVVRQLFERRLLELPGADREAALRGPAAPAASALGLPWPDRHAPDAHAVRHGLFWLAAHLCDGGALVIAVDDLHWSDVASLRWVLYLAARIDNLPMALVVTVRTPEATPHDLVPALGLEPAAIGVHLAPLTLDATAALIEQTYGTPVDAAFGRACHAATGGNPFLVRELLRALRDEGVMPSADQAAAVGAHAPASVTRSILVRLARLPAQARALARVVAVLGESPVARAAAMAGLSSVQVGRAADALVAAGIFRTGRPLAFAHPLLRAALNSTLSAAERSEAHARAARLLERDGAGAELVATHLLGVDAAEDDWAVRTLMAAGQAALERGAPEAAAAFQRRALEEAPTSARRGAVLLALGITEELEGEPAALDHLREAWQLAATADDRVAAARCLGRALMHRGDFEAAVEILRTTRAGMTTSERELRLALESELVEASRYVRSAVGPARRRKLESTVRGDSPGERVLLAALAFDAFGEARPAAETTRLAEGALHDSLLDESLITLYAALVPLVGLDRFDVAEHWLRRALEHAEHRSSALGRALATAWLAKVHVARGKLAVADATAGDALYRCDEYAVPIPLPIALAVRAEVRIAQGAADAAVQEIAARQLPEAVERLPHVVELEIQRARAHLAGGDPSRALAAARLCGERMEAFRSVTPATVPWRSTAALALLALGEREEARRLADAELALARRVGTPRVLARSLLASARVEGDTGEPLLRKAVAAVKGSGSQLMFAQASTELGAALRRRGRRTEARRHLRDGLDVAVRLGAHGVAEQARAELAVAGGRPRRERISGPEALTPSERRVALLAAEGKSNRQIAQALVVTVKAVEFHLGNVYRKLDVRSRHALPAALEPASDPPPMSGVDP
jgi:DNA-binding CsgD family transcriptional regulator